ncbi:hypothetical protein ACH35V_41060 [Actinomadura sp. 1N219]|uniref:hypothetical protein n=1 Tax=Actinomadura sp. 1N219 TaxID=3375152 RepID=UPI0037A39545
MGRTLAAATLAGAVIAAGACDGGASSKAAAPPIPAAKLNCNAISAGTLRQVLVNNSPQGRVGDLSKSPNECLWEGVRDGKTESPSYLDLSFKAYADHGEARAAYTSGALQGGSLGAKGKFTPVRGFGDDAGILRIQKNAKEIVATETTAIGLRFRSRNVIGSLWLTSRRRGIDPGFTGPLDSVSNRETAAVTAAREVLARLGTPASTSPRKTPPAQPGEARVPQSVCGASKTAGRVFGKGRDVSARGDEARRTCEWSSNGEERGLLLDAEAIAPSPLTGEGGIAIAGSVYPDWAYVPENAGAPGLAKAQKEAAGLGDSARMWTEWDPGRPSSTVRLRVRRGNLLVSVSLEEARSFKAVEERARRIATEVLESNL